MNYSSHFTDVVQYCSNNNLFIGYGNPNAKILILGKEKSNDEPVESTESAESIKKILDSSHSGNLINIDGWKKIIAENITPEWDNMPMNELSSLYGMGSQYNKPNRKTKEGWNGGTSNTYLKYQKLNQFLSDQNKSDRINFQKDFFLSELSDISTKYSYNNKELIKHRSASIDKRKQLFEMDFFKTFPIVIVAAGHYSRDYDFELEKIFDVKFTGKTTSVDKDWYNAHYSSDKKRILIHTRQLSMGVTDKLLQKIANECKPFLI